MATFNRRRMRDRFTYQIKPFYCDLLFVSVCPSTLHLSCGGLMEITSVFAFVYLLLVAVLLGMGHRFMYNRTWSQRIHSGPRGQLYCRCLGFRHLRFCDGLFHIILVLPSYPSRSLALKVHHSYIRNSLARYDSAERICRRVHA